MAALLVAVLAVSCIMIVNDSDESDAANATEVWVNGGNLSGGGVWSPSAAGMGGQGSYNSSTGVLTFNMLHGQFTGAHEIGDGTGYYASIYANGDLTIKFTVGYADGYNINFAPEVNDAKKMYGIYVQGNLTIISDINPKNLDWIGFNPGAAETESIGIYATGSITIDGVGVELRANGNGTSYGNDVDDKKSFCNAGIFAKTTLTIRDSKVSASAVNNNPAPKCSGGGTVYSYGLYGYSSVSITDSTVTATSSRQDLTYYVCVVETLTAGIYSNGGVTVIQSNDYCTVVATGGDICFVSTQGVTTSSAGGCSYGIRAATLTQTGGSITATGGVVFLPMGMSVADSIGVYITGDYTGSGAALTAVGSDATFYSCGMQIFNGDLNAGTNGHYTFRGGFCAKTAGGAKSIGLKVGGTVSAGSGTEVNSYGGVICYPEYTAGIEATSFALTGNANVTGYGGTARNTYTSQSAYQTVPFTVLGGSVGDSYGIRMFEGTISVGSNATLKGVGGNIVSNYSDNARYTTAGIYFYISGSISGSGKVISIGGETNYGRNRDYMTDSSYGLYCAEELTINGTQVMVTGGDVCTVYNSNRPYSNGASTVGLCADNLALTNHANVQAAGGELKNYPHLTNGYAALSHDSIGVVIGDGNLTVTNSTLLAEADSSAMRVIGIKLNGGMSISGDSNVTVRVPSAFTASNAGLGTNDGIGSGSYGIYIKSDAASADITVNAGRLTIESQTRAILSANSSNTLSAPYIYCGGTSETTTATSIEFGSISSTATVVYAITSAFTVTFNNNGGTGTMNALTDKLGRISLPNSNFTAPIGKHFAGWCTNSGGTGTVYPVSVYQSSYYTVLDNVTFYAIWELTEYEVRFSNNGGEGSMDSLYKHYNDTFALPENGFTAPNHYSFKCWRIESTEYDPGDTVTMPASMMDVLAVWQVDKHTVTFDGNGGTGSMASQMADYGSFYQLPECSFTAPAHKQFACWSVDGDNIAPGFSVIVYGDVTVTAVWEWMSYTIRFENYNHAELYSHDFEYNTTPTYNGPAPTRGADVQYTYTFSGWDPEISAVTGTATYVATYTPTLRSYTITFENEDGTQLQSSLFAYGATPVYSGQTPTKAQNAQYTYAFNGWSPTIESVTGETTYTATYTPTLRSYTITFVNEDGTQLQSSQFAYGATPVYSGQTPTKSSTVQYDYPHSGWDPAITSVTGEATYTATYTPTLRSYTITFQNEDGTELQSSDVEFGTMPAYSGSTPLKAADARYHYTFQAWSPQIVQVSGEATYTATYSSALNKYTVSFETEEGSGTMGDVEVDAGDYTLPANGFIAVNNRHFTGWRMGSMTGTMYLTGSTCEILADTTFYAQWEDHEHQLQVIPGTPATCTQTGLTDGQRCTICDGIIIEQTIIPALGHDYVPVITNPTCTEGGYTTHTCSICGDHYVDAETQATGHSWSATYIWSADVKVCTVHLVCANDSTHVHDINADVTSAVKTAATTSAMGVTQYSVTGTYDGFAYSDSKDVTDIPVLEPEYTLGQTEGTPVYTSALNDGMETQVTGIFGKAKSENGSVELSVGKGATAFTITFDSDAVGAIGGKAVTLQAKVTESSTDVPDAKLILEVSLSGATFSEGKATVIVPFTQAVPDGKTVKVYYINGDQRVDMNASYADDKLIFETDHFSTYAVFFEDAPSGNNGGGFPIWVVFVIVAVVAVGGGAFLFISKKKA